MKWLLLKFGVFVLGLVLFASSHSAEEQWKADSSGYDTIVAPFFKQHCLKCHGEEKAKGDFRVDAKSLPNDFLDVVASGKWKEIVNVLNSHEMPPKKEPQPKPAEVSAVVDWITAQTVLAEQTRRDRVLVLRRINRDEYRNTIRDLIGIDFDVSGFPQDPPSGGFDNNGKALSVSPLHVELYLNAAKQILDRALVEGPQPGKILWKFDPQVGPADRRRVRLDPKNNALLNGGNNKQEGPLVTIHHNSWDKSVGARDFRVPTEGTYIIRFQAASRVPNRKQVVESARKLLQDRRDKQMKENPKGAKYHEEQLDRDLKHFETDRIYDYGPPRTKLILQLGPQPKTVAELDIDAPPEKPKTYEIRAKFTTESAGVHFEYAYSIPSVLENFWMQRSDVFARPELLIGPFEIEGPIYESWPPPSHRGLLFDSPNQKDERSYAREILTQFMRKAFRRPVTPEEVDKKLALFDRVRKEKPGFVEAIKIPLIAVLASPNFLYLAEPTRTDAKGPRALSDFEFASRLSYFLWSSMPDETLLKLAESGKLRDPATLRSQIDRMLNDPKSEALTRNFVGQWLGLREVGANPPAPDLYPHYDRHLEVSIIQESEAFFREILKNDLSAKNFIRSDFVTINERLARFYGIPDVRGDEFRKVKVPETVKRGGIVTQASILTITSNGTRTSPVKRGTWVLKNLLGLDPGLPVANAGEIAAKVEGIQKATVRKRLEIHREREQCARCHNKIDPLGFALENYNASGEWREQEGFGYKGRISRDDPKIDASSMMPDGTQINGVTGLQAALMKQEDLFLKCLATKLITYALGRELGLSDQPLIDSAVKTMKAENYTVRSLIRFIVLSEAFGTK
jgi:mono/diheme cytochrome c family protein